MNQLGADTQRTASARRLNSSHSIVLKRRMFRTEHQMPDGLVEALVAGGAEVWFGILLGVEPLLGGFNCFENRGETTLVAIHTDAEIDFVRRRIVTKSGNQSKNRILGRHVEHLKHASCLQ